MTVTYGFYDSVAGDRRYNAIQMSSIFDGIITNGIFSSIGTCFMVTPGTGLQVLVGEGRAWFNHTWTLNDAVLPLTIETPDVLFTRIDAVILEIDSGEANRANSIKVLKGTPASNPEKPALTNSGNLHQYPLAYVYVRVGRTQINAADIENAVGLNATPYITSLMQGLSIENIVAQLEALWDDWQVSKMTEFEAWFQNLENQLTENQATNLQNQIDHINDRIDDGWIADTNTWVPDPGYEWDPSIACGWIDINADLTGKIREGTRVKFTQVYHIEPWQYHPFESLTPPDDTKYTISAIGSPTFTPGKFGNALTLNGTNQGVLMSDRSPFPITPSTEVKTFTYRLIMKTSTGGTLVSVGTDLATPTAGFTVSINATTGFIEVRNGTKTISGKSKANYGYPYDITVTYQRGLLQVYLQGSLDVSMMIDTPELYSEEGHFYTTIGCKRTGVGTYTGWFNGQIDDFMVLNNYALDENTINALRNVETTSRDLYIQKMGIIFDYYVDAGVTYIRPYMGTDYVIDIATITNPCYSNEVNPTGFIRREDKWSRRARYVTSYSKVSPVANTWYLLAPSFPKLPSGRWKIKVRVPTRFVSAAGGAYIQLALSSVGTYDNTNSIMTSIVDGIEWYSSLAQQLQFLGILEGNITVLPDMTPYLYVRTTNSDVSNISHPCGDSAPLSFVAVPDLDLL